jgi:hypothetical protein
VNDFTSQVVVSRGWDVESERNMRSENRKPLIVVFIADRRVLIALMFY